MTSRVGYGARPKIGDRVEFLIEQRNPDGTTTYIPKTGMITGRQRVLYGGQMRNFHVIAEHGSHKVHTDIQSRLITKIL